MIVPVMAISNLVLTRQIYSEEINGAHAHNRDRVPLRFVIYFRFSRIQTYRIFLLPTEIVWLTPNFKFLVVDFQ